MNKTQRKKKILYVIIACIVGGSLVAMIVTLIQDKKTAWFYTSLFATVVTIAVAVIGWTMHPSPKKSNLIEHKLHDDKFVDREDEKEKLLNLILNGNDHIIYVTGKHGMGKSHFIKMMCDFINFDTSFKNKKVVAIYHFHDRMKSFDMSVAKKFCNNESASIADIGSFFTNEYPCKKHILFIDNIDDITRSAAVDFAKAFIKCDEKNNIVVIAINIIDADDATIVPSEFREPEIQMLADIYHIEIDKDKKAEISRLGNGYPIYTRFLIETHSGCESLNRSVDIDNYIFSKIAGLSNSGKTALSIISCIHCITGIEIDKIDLFRMCEEINNTVLNEIKFCSLIGFTEKTISIQKLIAEKCKNNLSEYIQKSHSIIYAYYKNHTKDNYIALVAAIESDIQVDLELLQSLLMQQHNGHNFYFLIRLGKSELTHLNINILNDDDSVLCLRYYYLNALLELGYYQSAREMIDLYSNDSRFGIMDKKTSTISEQAKMYFNYQYALLDLEHLTNDFETASILADALLNKAITSEQKYRCLYLKAHCIRHMGENLNQAYKYFSYIADTSDLVDDKIRIRALYSAASIKMFEGDRNYDYDKVFEEIDNIIEQNKKNGTWIPYVNRHKAIYQSKIKNDYDAAKKIISETLLILETTSLRIKYDFYFELAEIYRLLSKTKDSYDESLKNYNLAITFAEDVGDYNLQSMSEMGVILLNLKYNRITKLNEIETIAERCKKIKLNINYNSAIYIKHLVEGATVPNELINSWSVNRYWDLLSAATSCGRSKNNLKLTIM